MNNLLIEIGTEEIPAGYIEPALDAFSSLLLNKLTSFCITHGNTRVFGTPRRLAVEVSDVSAKQEPRTTQITGPPERVGFDQNGNPTIAAKKFAEKLNISVSMIKIRETDKGRYLFAEKKEKRISTKNILKTILPEIILSVPFPKTMRWADLDIEFARPIQSLMAVFGENIISFSIGNVKSGRYTFGHRFMCPGRIKIDDTDSYIDILRRANVLVDIKERKKTIIDKITKLASDIGGSVKTDDELVDIVTNIVEYPSIVSGWFDTKFLKLPDEVLITSMREHQKYFSVIDKDQNLMPCFIAVNNTRSNDTAIVSKGHERVLRSRLEDAMFFYNSDLESSFEQWNERLKGVLFQAELGSMYKKVVRIGKISELLSGICDFGNETKKNIMRAALLCKADLVSHIVVEFPRLQGVMGRVYAINSDEPAEVAAAIEEHYMPTRSRGVLPETIPGSIIGIADKIDTICACFSIGLIPTGASDPYALRRQGIGIIQIMLQKKLTFSLKKLVNTSLSLFEDSGTEKFVKTSENIYDFFKNRMSHFFAEDGFAKDIIAAVISASADNVPDVLNRIRALENLKSAPDFEPIAIAFKRVVNIIKKSAGINTRQELSDIDEKLFEHESESALYSACNTIYAMVSEKMDKGLFDKALHDIASIRSQVDIFFDNVLVMAEDKKIRANRLALLGNITNIFEKFADFSKIST